MNTVGEVLLPLKRIFVLLMVVQCTGEQLTALVPACHCLQLIMFSVVVTADMVVGAVDSGAVHRGSVDCASICMPLAHSTG